MFARTRCLFRPNSSFLSQKGSLRFGWNQNNQNTLLFQFTRSFSSTPKYEHIIADTKGKVGIITLNRPKQLNALCDSLIEELNKQLHNFDNDSNIGAIIITGSDKAFAAGADIKEMSSKSYMDAYKKDMLSSWNNIKTIKKPIIAAVNGFALGGGCELAMMCDIILAGDKAKFGQPEVMLGTIPGFGGTQRLIRAVGKSKAMELILTGNQFTALEAEKAGLVSRVFPSDQLIPAALEMTEKISSYSKPIIAMAKESVNASYNLTLEEGVHFERRLFHSTFATKDQKEGMSSFLAKKKPEFTDS